jgi:hypothetical protein
MRSWPGAATHAGEGDTTSVELGVGVGDKSGVSVGEGVMVVETVGVR